MYIYQSNPVHTYVHARKSVRLVFVSARPFFVVLAW